MFARWNKVKIVATIGPDTAKPQILRKMVRQGMTVARFNFSHDSPAEHAPRIQLVREAFRAEGRPAAILQDLPGPKLRLGTLAQAFLEVHAGQEMTVENIHATADPNVLPFPDPFILKHFKKGDRVYISDGTLRLEVLETDGRSARCVAGNTATIRHKAGVNLPDIDIPVAAFTKRDAELLKFGLETGVDFVAVSFVSSAKDIKAVRKAIGNAKKKPFIIAKIERANAMKRLDEIIAETDGVMVARGDLGVEMEPAQVPFAQKEIIARCRMAGKPVIVATQMLESMISEPRPTRAELTDVANAALDGADAVMLSGETSIGKYPVEAVKILADVTAEAEKHIKPLFECDCSVGNDTARSVANSAADLAEQLGAAVIVCPSHTGTTMRCLSQLRPSCPIISICHKEDAAKHSLFWGVRAYERNTTDLKTVSALMKFSSVAAAECGLVKHGDTIVTECSFQESEYPQARVITSFQVK